MKQRRPTLLAQLLVVLICLAALPALLLGLVQIRAWSESEAARADRETLLASTSLAREVGGVLDSRAEVVRALASELGAKREYSADSSEAVLSAYLTAFPGFYLLMATDLQGAVLGAAPPQRADGHAIKGTSYADRTYFQSIVAGAPFAASDMLHSKATGRPTVILAAPVRRAGQMVGVLIAGVELALVQHAVERVTLVAPGLSSVVLDSAEQVVASAGSSPWKPLQQLRQWPLFRSPTGDAPERRQGADQAGTERRGTIVRVQSNVVEWAAFSSLPELAVQDRVHGAVAELRGFLLGALLLGVVLALFLARLIAGPIARLATQVERMGSGDLRVRSDPARPWHPRELAELSGAIDSTLARLHALLQQIGGTAAALSEVTQRLQGESTALVQESQQQQQAMRHGSGAIVKMTDSIADVSANARDLSKAAGESSSSLLSLDQQIVEIAGQLQALTSTIDHASYNVEHMGLQVNAAAETADLLDANVHDTTGSVDVLARSIEHVATIAAHSEKLAQDAKLAAEGGRAAVDQTISVTVQIQESFSALQAAVERLAGRSEAIGEVVRVIDEVTRATQLLAINALIIASQAGGEHGRAFGVVADRVKTLASETAASTDEIVALVESVQTDIRQAVEAVKRGQQTVQEGEKRSAEAGLRLQVISESSEETAEQVREIAHATRLQASGLQGVRSALDDVMEATARIKSASSAQSLAQQEMTSTVAQVRSVGHEVRRSTELQKLASHSIADAVRAMTNRLTAIAAASQAQNDDRERIESSLHTFEGASRTSVERARQLGAVVANLSARLEQLEAQLRSFRLD